VLYKQRRAIHNNTGKQIFGTKTAVGTNAAGNVGGFCSKTSILYLYLYNCSSFVEPHKNPSSTFYINCILFDLA
jgi:hypothetical protein